MKTDDVSLGCLFEKKYHIKHRNGVNVAATEAKARARGVEGKIKEAAIHLYLLQSKHIINI